MANSIKFDDSGLHEQQTLSQKSFSTQMTQIGQINADFNSVDNQTYIEIIRNLLSVKIHIICVICVLLRQPHPFKHAVIPNAVKNLVRHNICLLLLLVAFFLQYNTAQGQNFYGGAMAGINGCQVGGDELSGYHKAGFFCGGFVGWRFTPMSALRMELEFSQKGSKETPTEENGYYYYLMHLNCIDLPVLYQLFFNIQKQKFSFEAGLSYTYIIGDPKEECEVNGGYSYIYPGSGRPFTPSSLNIVAGLYYHITQNLFVNLRTSNGLTPIRTDFAIRCRMGAHGQYNDVLTLSIGWDFGKGAVYE